MRRKQGGGTAVDKPGATNNAALRSIVLLQCVGYALFNALIYRSSLVSIMASVLGLSTMGTTASAVVMFAASGVACIVACLLGRNGINVMRTPVLTACYATAAVLGVVMIYTSSEGLGFIATLLMGAASGIPLLYWFDGYYCIYRMAGGPKCIATIAVATMLGLMAPLLLNLLRDWPWAVATVLVAGALGATLCQRRIVVLGGDMLTVNANPPKAHRKAEKYQLSPYIAFTIASFGVMAGLARGLEFVEYGGIGGYAGAVPVVTPLLPCALTLLYAWTCRKRSGTQFGLLIRLSLTATSIAFVSAPLLSEVAPWLLRLLCGSVYFVQGVAMTLISVEISYERRMSTVDVMPVNYMVYVVCGCLTMVWPVLVFEKLATHAAWDVMAVIAVVATVAVIPALPATTSSASTFALKHLPENQNYEDRTAQARAGVIAKYGLSPRESEVLGLLVLGRTRVQIAQELNLSSWTVKEYVAGIYGKVGVHSAKELMVLVASSEGK